MKSKTIVTALRDFKAASPSSAGAERDYSRGLRPDSPLSLRVPSRTPFGEACGRTALRHCKSRAALPSQSLAPRPLFVSSCSQPPPNERCKVLPWLLLVRPVPGDSTLKFHCDGGRKADAQRLQVRALLHTPEIPYPDTKVFWFSLPPPHPFLYSLGGRRRSSWICGRNGGASSSIIKNGAE